MTSIRAGGVAHEPMGAIVPPAAGDDLATDQRFFINHVGLATVFGLLLSQASIRALPGWAGATVAVGQGLVLCALMLLRRPSTWLVNLTLFGVVAGITELAADAWLVFDTKTLVYSDGPRILASPIYMPAAWFGMLSAGMALGMALRRRLSLSAASVAVALALALYIPLYEHLAAHAGWWRYHDTPLLIDNVPHYIVLGELLLSLPLVAVTERLARVRRRTAIGLGIAQGAWIFASYGIAYTLVGV
jgi:hypothetical protein